MKDYTLDAENKSLGRVASEAVVLLMGKNTPTFRRNTVADAMVTITNASKIKYDPKKLKTKLYARYSGYPGGRRERTMQEVIEKKGYKEVFEKAVYGMLPANKLRDKLMKHLIITD
ncbi:MAG: 50S ribosomal protein L13 [Patescibacteria group bacterium]